MTLSYHTLHVVFGYEVFEISRVYCLKLRARTKSCTQLNLFNTLFVAHHDQIYNKRFIVDQREMSIYYFSIRFSINLIKFMVSGGKFIINSPIAIYLILFSTFRMIQYFHYEDIKLYKYY